MDKNKKKKKATMPGDPEKRREYMRKIQNPISKYDKKGNLIYTGVKEGAMAGGVGFKKLLKERKAKANISEEEMSVRRGREKAKKVRKKLKNFGNQAKGFVKEITGFKTGGVSRGTGAAVKGTKFQGVF